MKNFFKVMLKCPYCNKRFEYNIISFRAKCECSHCGNDLFVRVRPFSAAIISAPGLILLVLLGNILNIFSYGKLIQVLYLVGGGFIYLSFAYKFICTRKVPEKLYIVDLQDPTILERKRNKNKFSGR